MAKGILKDIGGSKRMRIVRPGYDANNLSLEQNLVIFDSNQVGNLSIHTYGEVTFGPFFHSGVIVNGIIATWPDLGYAPFVTMQYNVRLQTSGSTISADVGFGNYIRGSSATTPDNFRVESRRTGLWFFWNRPLALSGEVAQITLKFQAFRTSL